MFKNTLKKKNTKRKSQKLKGGNTSVWKDLLRISVIPSLKKGGKKTLNKKLYQPLGHNKANRIMKGGFVRAGSTQFFPVNCTRVKYDNLQNLQNNLQN